MFPVDLCYGVNCVPPPPPPNSYGEALTHVTAFGDAYGGNKG